MLKPLTVGIDVRDLKVAKTGIRTYLEELCKEFKKMNKREVRFHFIDTILPVYSGEKKILKWIEHLRYQIWKQLVLPLKAFFKDCDIVFCTDGVVPFFHLRYKTIPVFHDAFPFESPEAYNRLWLLLYMKTAIPAAKRSPFVITPSLWSKKQIHYFTGIADEKLKVIYEGPKDLNTGDNTENEELLLVKFKLGRHNYLLHAGAMFKRKNIPALIEAFAKIKAANHPGLKLVLVGAMPLISDNDYKNILKTIEVNKLGDDVVLTGYLTDADLGALYRNALMYVFPSVNEGFGIPVLEAFKNNLPVLVANNTCLPEVGGDAVLQFDPFDTNDIFLKIKTVLDDEALRKKMIDKGLERLELFSWQNTARELVEVFIEAR